MKSYKIINSDLLAEYDSSRGDKSEFWDQHWQENNIKSTVNKASTGYLGALYFLGNLFPKKSKILEAGCGNGNVVIALNKRGYDIIGVDNAKETVKIVNDIFPGQRLVEGDLFSLPFEDNFFDHYISLGVIEHYEDEEKRKKIIREAKRITKKSLFISVPYYSKRLKQKNLESDIKNKDFYQYYFTQKSFVSMLETYNLQPLDIIYYSTYIGLRRHSKVFRKIYESNKIIRFIVSRNPVLTDKFFGKAYGHMIGVLCSIN